jgi:hypothetical protein
MECWQPRPKFPKGAGTVHVAPRSSHMERFSYKFTDLLDFSSPSMEMWLAPAELLEFASTVAQEMLVAQPGLVDKGSSLVSSIRGYAWPSTIAAELPYQWCRSAPCIDAALQPPANLNNRS